MWAIITAGSLQSRAIDAALSSLRNPFAGRKNIIGNVIICTTIYALRCVCVCVGCCFHMIHHVL